MKRYAPVATAAVTAPIAKMPSPIDCLVGAGSIDFTKGSGSGFSHVFTFSCSLSCMTTSSYFLTSSLGASATYYFVSSLGASTTCFFSSSSGTTALWAAITGYLSSYLPDSTTCYCCSYLAGTANLSYTQDS
jgi:hypothetical protein